MLRTSRALIFYFAGSVLFLAGCGRQSSAEAIKGAKTCLAKEDTNCAVINLKAALQQEPRSGEARFLLGKAYLEAGDAESASVELRKALDLQYPKAQVTPELARALLALQKYKAMVDEFATVDLAAPAANADLKTSLASAYASLGNTDKAQAGIQAALKAVPDFPAALLLQARIMTGEGKFDEALGLIDKVIAAAPADAEAWYDKGIALARGKADAAGAIAAFTKAVTLKPRHVLARSDLISLLLAKPDLKAAAEQMDQLRKMAPKSPQLLFFDAQMALINGKPKVALQLINEVVISAPENANVLELAGAIQLENGLLPQAERSLSHALDLAPNSTVSRQRLAQVELRMGQPAKALAALEPLLASPSASARTYALAGEAHLQSGDLDLARANFASAVKMDPSNAMTRTSLALANLKSAGVEATATQLRAIAASDKGTAADMALVGLLTRNKDFAGALAAVDAIEKKLPNSPVASDLRGQVYLLEKDVPAARKNYEHALEVDPLHVPAASMLAALDVLDGKPDVARKRFEKILAADPSNYPATMEMAKMLSVAHGSKDEIERQLTKAINLRPGEEEPRLLLIEHFLDEKNAKAALNAANDATAALPYSTRLLDALGRAQAASLDLNQAITTFGKLANMQPNSPAPLLQLAGAYLKAKDNAAAEKTLRQALAMAPDLLPAQQALIQILVIGKRQDEALALARSVQKQRPDSEVGTILEGNIESSRGNWKAAVKAYGDALKKAPLTPVAIKLHGSLVAAKDGAGADKMAANWTAEHPKDPEFLSYLGDSAMALGNFEAAEGRFRSILALQPGNIGALNNLAWTMAKLGQPGAVAYAEQAVKLKPDTPGLLDTLAFALAAEKQLDKALEVEKRALKLAAPPSDQVLRLNLAKLYLQAGDNAAARNELEALAKLGGRFGAHAEVMKLLASL